ncbi:MULTISPECIES: hypothetical protein [Rhodococcus]|uniref:hypothetical protein n=1 Tax=Rhodococcus TaxID=1827 RepID=UPI0013586BE5|nr:MULTISPECIES: hypothetical protein [Rhodococcus]KAF0956742.1 hypothetical protein MLGJGCBP_10150 [Rhodococcus sp. T7]KAF0966615.1 hypothetical protein MLGJGCBP_00240 [Rhodococcus sp. T7]UOT08379.1 hypothetical protein MPY17_39500 [Rhodococcus opacus]
MNGSDRHLDVLLADYTSARDDERELLNQQTTLFRAVVATLTLLGALVASISGENPTLRMPDWISAAAPLVPLALICLLQIVGSQAAVRSFYIRALERQLRKELPSPPTLDNYPRLTVMSYQEIQVTLRSLGQGTRIPRILTMIIFFSVGAVFIGLVMYMASTFDIYLKFTMIVFYGAATALILMESVNATVRGKRYFQNLVDDAHRRSLEPLTPSVDGTASTSRRRSLASYLILPRPADLSKAPFFPIGALVLVAVRPETAELEYFWPRVVVLWLVLEVLVYQARYQWNDLRGLGEDMQAPAAGQRGRIPLDPTTSDIRPVVILVSCVISVRLFLAVLACALPFVSFFHHMLPMLLGVFGLAAVYEILRGMERNGYVPTTQGPLQTSPSSVTVLVSLVVGLGYPLRTVLGITLPATGGSGTRDIPWQWTWPWNWTLGNPFHMSLPVDTMFLAVFALYTLSLGILFVSMTWCLEGGTFVREHDGSTYYYRRDIAQKPHLRLLLLNTTRRFAPLPAPTQEPLQPIIEVDGRSQKWLKYASRLHAPWNIALLTALATGALAVCAIWGSDPQIPATALAAAATVGISVAMALHRNKSKITAVVYVAGLLLAAVTLAAAAAHTSASVTAPSGTTLAVRWILSSMSTIPILVYKFFEHSSYRDLAFPPLTDVVTKGVRRVLVVVLGKDTAMRMGI